MAKEVVEMKRQSEIHLKIDQADVPPGFSNWTLNNQQMTAPWNEIQF